MNTTLSLANTQRQRLKTQRQSINSTTLFNALTSDALFDEVERLSPDHRERLFTPTETLSLFLTQSLSADRSCQNIVNQTAIDRLASGLPICSSHTGAYCPARQRLPVDMISGLTRHLGAYVDQKAPTNWQWKGRQVYIADGTTMTMPDTESNQSAFPQQGAQKPGLGFPICRFVGVISLSSGMLLDGAVGRFNGKGAT